MVTPASRCVLALLLSSLPFLPACATAGSGFGSAPVQEAESSPTAAKAEQDKKDEEAKQRGKELQQKQRELDYAKIAVQTTAIERQVRTMTVEAAVQHAQRELDKKQRELDQFLQQLRPRELEEHQIDLDHQVHRAEDAKDELAELEAMYKDDEFAKTTKELVVKRGRRQLEMAARGLAVGRQEFEQFEKHTLVEREQELQQAAKDAALELEKARLEHQKTQIELDVQQRQADDRVKDLQRDIAELEAKSKGDGK